MPLPADITPEELAIIDRRVSPSRGAWRYDEHDLQRTLIAEMDLRAKQVPELRRLHAVPNGGHRSSAAAGKMKAEGQKPGVPDLSMPVPRGGYLGFYLELKKSGNGPTDDQWDWLLHLHRAGYAAYVANDVNTARTLILSYLEP